MKISNKILYVQQTCGACPSQWDILLSKTFIEDSEEYNSIPRIISKWVRLYIRYRHGIFSVREAETNIEEEFSAVNGTEILNLDSTVEDDGFMKQETMLELLKEHLDYK